MGDARVYMTPAPVFFAQVMRRGGDVDGAIKRRAELVEALAIQFCPKKSGRLASTIRVEQRRDRGQFSFGYEVSAGGPRAPYVGYVVRDTSPHVIPGNPRLSFFWERMGLFVSFASVNHPGTHAQPFLDEALQIGGRG